MGLRIIPTDDNELDLHGHTLVVPGCGLGHLGELAVDALMTTFALRRVAIVQSPYLLPMVTSSAWEPPSCQEEIGARTPLALTTAAELYQGTKDQHLSVLQIRTGATDGKRRAVAQEIFAWAEVAGVSNLVIVSSCASYVKIDQDFAAQTELRFIGIGEGASWPEQAGLGTACLPLGHGLADSARKAQEKAAADAAAATAEGLDEAASRAAAALAEADARAAAASDEAAVVQEVLRGGGLARPMFLAAVGAQRAELRSQPAMGALCLVGMTTESVDMGIVEGLTQALVRCLIAGPGIHAPQSIRAPISWMLEAMAPNRRLWT